MATKSKDVFKGIDFKKKIEEENKRRKELKENYNKLIEIIKSSPSFCKNPQEWDYRVKLGMALAITRSTYSDGSLNFKLYRKDKQMLYFIVSPIDFQQYTKPDKAYTMTTTLDDSGNRHKNSAFDDLSPTIVDDNVVPHHPASVSFGTSIDSQEVSLFYNSSSSQSTFSEKSLSDTQPLEEDEIPQKTLSRAPTEMIKTNSNSNSSNSNSSSNSSSNTKDSKSSKESKSAKDTTSNSNSSNNNSSSHRNQKKSRSFSPMFSQLTKNTNLSNSIDSTEKKKSHKRKPESQTVDNQAEKPKSKKRKCKK